MPYIRDTAVVLKKDPFRDHDRRYVVYGREQGKMSAIARGSCRSLSKQAGHLEPFETADVMIAPGRAFDHIAVARNVAGEKRPPFSTLAAYAVLGGIADLVLSLTRPGLGDERIFDLLIETRDVCAAFSEEPTMHRARFLAAASTLKLIDLLGFGPPLKNAPLSPQALTLVQFIRRFSIVDTLRVTARTDAFDEASIFVEDALRHTPLLAEPHGAKTIHALCH